MIEAWFHMPRRSESDGACIPVRILGATRMMTPEEFEEYNKGAK
jgi:hypothetical protein